MQKFREIGCLASLFVLFSSGCGSGPEESQDVDPVKQPVSRGPAKYSSEEQIYVRKAIALYRQGAKDKAAWEEHRNTILDWSDHRGEEFLITFFCAHELRPNRLPEDQSRARKEMTRLLRIFAKRGSEGARGLHFFAQLLLIADTNFVVTWGNDLAPAAGSALVPELLVLVETLDENVRKASTGAERYRLIIKLGWALKALASCGRGQAVSVIARIYETYRKDPSEDAWKPRLYVAGALELTQDDGALDLLIRMLDDPDRLIREKAARVILGFRSSASVGPMVEVLERYRNVEAMRRSTLSSLRKTAGEDLGPDPDVWIEWHRKRGGNR